MAKSLPISVVADPEKGGEETTTVAMPVYSEGSTSLVRDTSIGVISIDSSVLKLAIAGETEDDVKRRKASLFCGSCCDVSFTIICS